MYTRWEAVILTTNLEWRHALARTLYAHGIDCAYATRLEGCKEILAHECVNLVFWDSHLADGSYQELARSLRTLDDQVKIVIVSHQDSPLGPAACTEAFGVIPFPGQPTDIEWVLSRVARAELKHTRADRHREVQPHW
jgi:DNA-binding NtrC family response regulator